jgi:hypothetical protein
MLFVEKAENRHGQRALAGAALPHETQHFTRLNCDLDVT